MFSSQLMFVEIDEPVYGGQSGWDGEGKVEANSHPFIHKFTQSTLSLPCLYCPLSEKDSTELTGFQCKMGAKGLCGCVNGQQRGVPSGKFVIYR